MTGGVPVDQAVANQNGARLLLLLLLLLLLSSLLLLVLLLLLLLLLRCCCCCGICALLARSLGVTLLLLPISLAPL